MSAIFSPSLMCADFGHLEDEIKALEDAGCDRFHIDLMDGIFVPNFAIGFSEMNYICKTSTKKTEVHMMITDANKYIDQIAKMGADIIYIHPEGNPHPVTTLSKIRDAGVEMGIAISPGTAVSTVVELLNFTKHVLVMGVNPGHAGQSYLSFVDHKIDELISLKEKFDLEIMIDGACNNERIKRWHTLGVDGYVLGTAALFGKSESYQETIRNLRQELVCE